MFLSGVSSMCAKLWGPDRRLLGNAGPERTLRTGASHVVGACPRRYVSPMNMDSPRHYEASRREAVICASVAAAFVAGGWFLTHGSGTTRYPAEVQHAVGWICIVVAGPLILLFLLSVFRPTRVTFDDTGFEVQQPWGRSRYQSWDEIERVWARYADQGAWVVWTFRHRAQEGVLTGTWKRSDVDEIASELERVRQKAIHRLDECPIRGG